MDDLDQNLCGANNNNTDKQNKTNMSTSVFSMCLPHPASGNAAQE